LRQSPFRKLKYIRRKSEPRKLAKVFWLNSTSAEPAKFRLPPLGEAHQRSDNSGASLAPFYNRGSGVLPCVAATAYLDASN
jgi:hypothetical protein